MNTTGIRVTAPSAARAEKAAREDRDARVDTHWRPGHVSFVPGENLLVSVLKREGSFFHRVAPDCASGDGVAPLTGDELTCAMALYPQLRGYGECMEHAQAMTELTATREAAESALELFKREQAASVKQAAADKAAADKALKVREADVLRRERVIAERERQAEARVAAAEAKHAELEAAVKSVFPPSLVHLLAVGADTDERT